MEIAANVVRTAGSVTVVVHGRVPFESVFGAKLGAVMLKVKCMLHANDVVHRNGKLMSREVIQHY